MRETTQSDSHRISEIFFEFCAGVDSPISLSAWLRFQSDHKSLLELEIDPKWYNTADSFFHDYSVTSLLKKFKGLDTGIDTKEASLLRFATSESRCLATNRRLQFARNSVLEQRLAAYFYAAQRKIARVLGDLDVTILERYCGWGPGAAYEIPRRRAMVDTKIAELPVTVTRRAFPFFERLVRYDLHWSSALLGIEPSGPFSFIKGVVFDVVQGNRVDTVPKNAKTDRIIAVEPRANGFLQKGVGGYLRRRLKRFGVDLDNQAINQTMAGNALKDDLCTIDLSMASDTVAREVVFSLLPVDWANFLDALRCHNGELPDGSTLKYEKFSSMGNGFTFELESLLFWAITQSVVEAGSGRVWDLSIYGDDIICPAEDSSELVRALAFFGFEVNADKSFVDGLFFESCGKQYFNGVDVTPAYQKEVLDEIEAPRMGNRLLRLAYRLDQGLGLSRKVRPAWKALRKAFPETCHRQVPFGSDGDSSWEVPFSSWSGRMRRCPNRGLRCSYLKPLTWSDLSSPVGSGKPGSRVDEFSLYRKGIPGNERALLAHVLRLSENGSIDVAFHGDVDPPFVQKGKPLYRLTTRWVIPTREFQVTWTK